MTYLWLIVLTVAVIVELASCALLSIWFACGAVAALICAVSGAAVEVQILVFVCVSVICLVFFLLYFKKSIKVHKQETNIESLINSEALVEEEIAEKGKGRVRVSSMSWLAEEENGNKIEVGEWVQIIEIRGVTLIVQKNKN